jgi:hypothetical protein
VRSPDFLPTSQFGVLAQPQGVAAPERLIDPVLSKLVLVDLPILHDEIDIVRIHQNLDVLARITVDQQ